MIQPQSCLNVADNTGARTIMCIRVLNVGQTQRRSRQKARLGDIILGVVKETKVQMSVQKSEIIRAVIVRTSKETRRSQYNGMTIRFDENAAVLINKDGIPRGTRIFGPVARELREKKFMKILSLAPEVI